MATLLFVAPVHGRLELSAICLRQLRRTCDALTADGLEASAIVVADRENLQELELEELRFGYVERDNRFLSRRFNDGIQLACDPRYTSRPADFVVPIGSDDWVDHRILLQLPERNRIVVGFQRMSFVREDGREISSSFVDYPGGCGIRIYPRWTMRTVGYRPADEDRARGCDTSILVNLRRAIPNLDVRHRDVHERQIVDFKSRTEQLNPYAELRRYHKRTSQTPWEALSGTYPREAIEEMREHYAGVRSPQELAVA